MNFGNQLDGSTLRSEAENTPGIESAMAAEPMMGVAFVESAQSRGLETILLVEDEAFVRKVTAEVLESAGYSVVIAGNAPEALEAYGRRCQSVDLLLADVVMPGMSGRELAAEFKTRCPLGRILLMSGYADQLSLCQSSPDHKAYLGKPFSIGTLLKRVREVLDATSSG